MVGWWVPVDDTHTIGFHLEALRIENGQVVPSSLATAPVGRSTMMGEPRRTYEDTQRDPDDLEAQVSQRPIAIHALERKGTTDRGVIMCRKLLRRALRELVAGRDPQGIIRDPARRVIEVVSGNTVLAAPRETTTVPSIAAPALHLLACVARMRSDDSGDRGFHYRGCASRNTPPADG